MKTLFRYILLFLSFSQIASAQVYHFEHYGVHNGLGQSQVSDIIQDQFGYLWFSTQGGGVSRFDGLKFKTYRKEDGLPANNIASVKIDKQNRLMIGSYRGFSVFDGKEFRNITIKKRPPRLIKRIFSDNQRNIYVLFGKTGIGRFEEDSLKIICPNDTTKTPIFNATFDRKNNLYVAGWNGTIYRVNGSQLQPFFHLPHGFNLYGFIFDNENRLWIGTNKGAYIISNPNSSINLKDWKLVSSQIPFSVGQTSSGDTWLGLAEGVLRIEKNGNQTVFNAKNGFTNARITTIYEDHDGVVWLAADGDGVYKFTDTPFTYINSSLGLADNSIGTILEDPEGKLWLGTFSTGLYVWDGKKIIKTYNESNGLPCNVVTSSLLDSQGNKWFGSGMCGFSKIDAKGKLTTFTAEQMGFDGRIMSIVEGENHEIWFGSGSGLYVFDGKTFKRVDYNGKRIMIYHLLRIGNGEIVAFSGNDAYLMKNHQLKEFKQLGSWENSKVICSLYYPKQNMMFWGDMEEGVFAYNFQTQKKYHFSTKDGLSSNLIFNIIFDKNDNLWVGSEKGLDKIFFDKDFKIKDIRYYSKGIGFTGVETNAMTTLFDKEGHLWVGTIAGAYQYHPEKDNFETKPIRVHLTEVKLLFDTTKLDKYATSTDKWHRTFENLRLPYNKNSLSFSFIGIYHKNPEEVVYQYKLEGFDKAWSAPTTKKEINYTNLPAGEYTFLVRASNNCGAWCKDTLKYSFVITPPFWKTWWFSLLTLIFIIAAVYSLQRLYANYQTKRALAYEKLKQEAESEIRKQVAQDFHDELGNRLAAITTQSNVLKLKLSNVEDDNKKIVNDIEENARKLYTDTKDFIWAIDPESNRLNELVMYIRDFGEKLFQYTDIEFVMQSEISDEYEGIILPPGWSIQIIMIFKEAMTNALKHAQCKQVVFDYQSIANEKFVFTLEDDGKGIDTTANGNNQKGISNMQRRANKIQSILEFIQKQPKGTILRVSGKIPKKGG